jgi:hypothetical protein
MALSGSATGAKGLLEADKAKSFVSLQKKGVDGN